MQNDLDRLLVRKRRMHRVAGVLLFTVVAALMVVLMRSCSDRFEEPYNQDYRPMDTHRLHQEQSF